tara:strand:- start:6697 stop:7533 length:837 start_codon:yes stop_codon:yes gene_type:complete
MVIGENNITILSSDDFDINSSEEYHLSLKIGVNNFSFCILDNKKLYYQYIYTCKWDKNSIKENSEELINIISKNPFLQSKFCSYSLMYSGFPNTLIPYDIKTDGVKKKILELQSDTFENIFEDQLISNKIKIIYSIPKEITEITKACFPIAKNMSEDKVLIEQYIKNKNLTMYANIENMKVIITVVSDEKLIFHNSFNFITKEDLLYYMLFCIEQLNLSTETTEVVLYGQIERKTYNLLYEYIRYIRFGKRSNMLRIPDNFNINEHEHFSLLSQILCV